ncbi:MAG: peptidylprolyl isomerase [Flavobacteriales bacterium]|nr:peptidylprolyl isomerase [Flavobacteriales bacterium]
MITQNIKLALKLIFFSLIMSSCGNDKVEKKQVKIKKVKVIKKKTVLTHENAVEFLTEYGKKHQENIIEISTNYGKMKVKLYKDTPLHRANFIYLINEKYFDETFFHRVVKGFMIQGGNSDNWGASKKRDKIGIYKIPAEILPQHFHKKGALAASRTYIKNPDKVSTPFEFYIVQGHTFDKQTLSMVEEQYHKRLNAQQRKEYIRIGGTPHLDGEHTVFGEVIEGFDTIDKIASVKTDKGEWPEINVVIHMKTLK